MSITIAKSAKLRNVLYDIRGPIVAEAERLTRHGADILQLNIGNPMPFGFRVAEEISTAVIDNLKRAEGYVESKGIVSAREEIMAHYRRRGMMARSVDDVYIGNGVSELITMTMHALVDNGDEILIPSPDYPLWTAAATLSGGVPRHYRCIEQDGWIPDIDDIRSKITPRTKILVIINPNNPTGAVYPLSQLEQLADIAARHKLIICADEIYDHMLFDGAAFHSMGQIARDTLCLCYGGLSKNHLACGFRAGWMVMLGTDTCAGDYREGFDMLSNMRLCSNVPSQYAIAPALRLERAGMAGAAATQRLIRQRQVALERIARIDSLTCAIPQGAFYLFARINAPGITDDVQFALDLLKATNILVVQGSGFNIADSCHFRMTFLPHEERVADALTRIGAFIASYQQ